MLNGITEIATKSDLLDRSILIYLPRIEQSKRLPEKKFWKKFDEIQPGIIGALLDAAAVALRELPNTDLATLPRMADFALWATAAETGFGLNAGAFMCAYDGNQAEAHQVALEASPLAVELRDWFEGQEYWEGSPTALLGELNKRLEDHKENPKTKQGWPQSSRGLTMRLKVLGPDLRAIGVDAVYERVRGKSFVKIGKISASSASSAQVKPDKELTNSQQDALDAFDADDLHRSDGALDALDADGVFSGNGVNDSRRKTFADDAVDAHKNTTFTTDDPNITPAGWAAPF
jgi:hypothetical protein